VPAAQDPPLAEGDGVDDGVLLVPVLVPVAALVLVPAFALTLPVVPPLPAVLEREQAARTRLPSAHTTRSRTRARHCFFAMVYKTSQIFSLKYAVSPLENALPCHQTRVEHAPCCD
jgi:hypothetical protein